MVIFEMFEKAKKHEFDAEKVLEKGQIHISKKGKQEPIKLSELPKYQPERSKREDGIMYLKCAGCGEYIHIVDQMHRIRCGALNTMET